VNSVWDGDGLKWVCAEGESLPGPAKMDGNSHLLFRLEAPVRRFFEHAVRDGVSQHWLFVPEKRGLDLERLCAVLGIRVTLVT
jgi:hypothetical protein